jgi:hypothetical protein
VTAWHALCRAIGLELLPRTCNQSEGVRSHCINVADSCCCRSHAVRRTHVNTVGLIAWGRRGDHEHRVQTFSSVAKLRAYTKMTGKVFHNTFDQGDGNIVLRYLLRKLIQISFAQKCKGCGLPVCAWSLLPTINLCCHTYDPRSDQRASIIVL